jgi:hypothetical protein
VVGDENADAALPEAEHDALDLEDGDRIDAREGLVEQDELGLEGQGPGDLKPPALAAREAVSRLARKLC